MAAPPKRPRAAPRVPVAPGAFVGDYLLYLLAAASHAVSAEFHTHVRRAGLRVPEWRVLACLSDVDGAMVTDLARLTLYDQPRLTKTLDQMQAKGLIERRVDAADKRRVRIHVTASGAVRVAPLIAAARAHEAAVLAALGPADAERVKGMLRRLAERAEASVWRSDQA